MYYKLSKLATIVEGDPKAPFSRATTPRCRGGHYSFFLDCSTLPLIRTLQCWVLSKEASSTIFWIFGVTRPGIELRSPGPLANTLTARPMSLYIYIYIYMCVCLCVCLCVSVCVCVWLNKTDTSFLAFLFLVPSISNFPFRWKEFKMAFYFPKYLYKVN